MGEVYHDAIIVTINRDNRGTAVLADRVAAFRDGLPGPQSPYPWQQLVIGPIRSVVNYFESYVFLPDGSKEGWADSDAGDRYRAEFIALFQDVGYGVDIIHARYGHDFIVEKGAARLRLLDDQPS